MSKNWPTLKLRDEAPGKIEGWKDSIKFSDQTGFLFGQLKGLLSRALLAILTLLGGGVLGDSPIRKINEGNRLN